MIRDAVRLGGGHATLIRAPDSVRRIGRVFQPQAAALAALSTRVEEAHSIPSASSIPAACTRGLTRRTAMQTNFTLEQLAERRVAESEKILRTCVHCGFCTATCPTYVLLGDELDSPRGRIYLIKDMLENDKPANAQVVKHIDRCLSCLSCMTTCPSGVALHASGRSWPRPYREDLPAVRRSERLMRKLLATVLPRPKLFRHGLDGAAASRRRPVAGVLPAKLKAMLELAPEQIPARQCRSTSRRSSRPQGTRRKRVAILNGCAQQVLEPGDQ